MLFVIYNAAAFLFFAACSISLTGIKFKKKTLIFLFLFSFVSLLIGGTIYLIGGTGLTNIFYPIYLHGALFLLMSVVLEIPLSLSFVAVMSANMISPIPLFFGTLVKYFSANSFFYYLTGVFPKLLNNITSLIIQCMPLLVMIVYFYFIIIFSKEMTSPNGFPDVG